MAMRAQILKVRMEEAETTLKSWAEIIGARGIKDAKSLLKNPRYRKLLADRKALRRRQAALDKLLKINADTTARTGHKVKDPRP